MLVIATITLGCVKKNDDTIYADPDGGRPVWVKQVGSKADEGAGYITRLPDGDLLIFGGIDEDIIFGEGEKNETRMTVKCNGEEYNDGGLDGGDGGDMDAGADSGKDGGVDSGGGCQADNNYCSQFIAKYTSSGTLVWVRHFVGPHTAVGFGGIAGFPDGSFVVTGNYYGIAVFGYQETNETTLRSEGLCDEQSYQNSDDIFIASYDSQGNLKWAKSAGGDKEDTVRGIASYKDGTIYITGDFQGKATFGKGEKIETVLEPLGTGDIFVAKYNPDGTLAWARRDGDYDSYSGYPVYWQGKAWEKGLDIAVSADGNILVTGEFWDFTLFGKGEKTEQKISLEYTKEFMGRALYSDNYDMFIAKYDNNGHFLWAKRVGGKQDDSGNKLAVIKDGAFFVAGDFFGEVTFGEGEEKEMTIQEKYGTSAYPSQYIAKYNPDGTLVWVRDVAEGVGENDYVSITALVVQSNGLPVVLGMHHGETFFSPGRDDEITLGSGNMFYGTFWAKFNSNGTLGWVRQLDGDKCETGYRQASGLTISPDGSSFVTGSMCGETIFGETKGKPLTLTSKGRSDIFIAKYSP